MKMILLICASILGIFILFMVYASHPWSVKGHIYEGQIYHVEPEGMVDNEDRPTVIKVLSWNLGFLYGEGSEGPGYHPKDTDWFMAKLNKLASEVHEWKPDIILFQEIDFNSSRSFNVDQALHVAKKAGYPYVAEAVSWDANYIPFPYWPIKRNFGRMKSGGAILSKYPIISHKVELLAKPASQPWWYNLFYLHRYFQEVIIELGNKKMKVVNLHLEAFDKVDRKQQIVRLIKKIKDDKIDLVAGDFNMVPDSATKKSKFENEDDYENDSSFSEMKKSSLLEVIPEDIYSQDESLYFTFPASLPDRRLDYIFFQTELKMMRAEVLPSTLSDHLPIKASFQIDSPKFNPYSL